MELLGENKRKLLKIELSSGTVAEYVNQLIGEFVSIENSTGTSGLFVEYYEDDVMEFKALNDQSWDKYLSITKKKIRISIKESVDIADDIDKNTSLCEISHTSSDNIAVETITSSLDGDNDNSIDSALSDNDVLPPIASSNDNLLSDNHDVWYQINTLSSFLQMKSMDRALIKEINGVIVSGLDRDFLLALLRQQCRPLHFLCVGVISQELVSSELSSDVVSSIDEVSSSCRDLEINDETSKSKNEIVESNDRCQSPQYYAKIFQDKYNYDYFLKRYNSRENNRLRKKIESLVKDFLECDWASVKLSGTGSPILTIQSLYPYIEAEMKKIGLFDDFVKPKSWLSLDFSDDRSSNLVEDSSLANFEYLKDEILQDHIETFICKDVHKYIQEKLSHLYVQSDSYFEVEDKYFSFIENILSSQYDKKIFLLFQDKGLVCASSVSSDCSRFIEFLSEPLINNIVRSVQKSLTDSLSLKLCFLRFVSLHQLGLDSKYVADDISNAELYGREEFRLAMKGFCRALQFDSPVKIMHKLMLSVRIMTNALDALCFRRNENYCSHDVVLNTMKCTCDSFHMVNVSSDNGNFLQDSDITLRYPSHLLDSSSICVHCRKDSSRECSETSCGLSADEIMPAITWCIIQSNPRDIEKDLWYCSEFRHPSRLHGEESFCLTQVTSAVEFCKAAEYSSFENLSELSYDVQLWKFLASMKLIQSCVRGELDAVISWVNLGANVNHLTVDQCDCPLSLCLRFKHKEVFRYLLTCPNINVNILLSPCQGRDQGESLLHTATRLGQLDSVLLLLSKGANRYHRDDRGVFPVTIARQLPVQDIYQVLLYDKGRVSLLDCVAAEDAEGVLSLLMQEANPNQLFAVDFDENNSKFMLNGCEAEIFSNRKFDEVSPLMIACERGYVEMTRILLHSKIIDVDLCNQYSETALLRAVKLGLICPSDNIIACISMLLQAGASRKYSIGGSIVDIELFITSILRVIDNVPGRISPSAEDEKADLGLLKQFQEYEDIEKNKKEVPDSTSHDLHSDAAFAKQIESDSTLLPDDNPLLLIYQYYEKVNRIEDNPRDAPLRSIIFDLIHFSPKVSSLPMLAQFKNYNGVRSLLLQCADLNVTAVDHGFTPLIASVYNRDYDMMELLLLSENIRQKCHLRYKEERNPNDPSHLHRYSINLQLAEQVKRYCSKFDAPLTPYSNIYPLVATIDIDFGGRNGMRALHYAAQVGDPLIVARLLQSGCNRHILNDHKSSALDIALWQMKSNGSADGKFSVVADLLKYDPAKVSSSFAAKHGDWSILNSLLSQGFPVNFVTPSSINVDSFRGDISAVTSSILMEESLCCPLIAAAAFGQSHIVRNLLKIVDINVNIKSPLLGTTPLMYAAKRLDETMVLMLLRHGADRWIKDVNGCLAIDWAQHRGFPGSPTSTITASKSIKKTSDQSIPQEDDVQTILRLDPSRVYIHDVIRQGDFKGVVAMLKQWVDVNHRRFGEYPKDIIEPLLLMRKERLSNKRIKLASCEVDGKESLSEYICYNRRTLDALDLQENELFKKEVGREIWWEFGNFEEHSLIHLRPRISKDIHLHSFHESPVDAEADDNTSSSYAIKRPSQFYRSNVVSSDSVNNIALPAHSLDGSSSSSSLVRSPVFFPGETPLIVACRFNMIDIVQLLLKSPDIKINLPDVQQGWTPLFHAAAEGHEAIVLKLLRHTYINRSLVDFLHCTAAEVSLRNGHPLISALIEADPKIYNIHDLCSIGKVILVHALLKQGCSPNAIDNRSRRMPSGKEYITGFTPLIAASKAGQLDIVRLLLRLDEVVDGINTRDIRGMTALMWATHEGHLDVSAMLLNAGCDRYLKDYDGLTAKDHANRHSLSTMMKFMGQNVIR